MSDTLGEIYLTRRRRLAEEMEREPMAALQERATAGIAARRPLGAALAAARPPAVIAEIKRASPSAGLIASEFDPAEIAGSYQAAGADAISVLTEEDYFQGHLSFLGLVRARSTLPILRKDFLTTPYQVVQSAAYGADAVLAIVAGLSDSQLRELLAAAEDWDLEVLVEVHTEPEMTRALGLGAVLLGINNRDLRTLRTDISVTERLLGMVPTGVQVVSESGFEDARQIERACRAGASSFLVGEALMRAPDRAKWVQAVKSVGAVEA